MVLIEYPYIDNKGEKLSIDYFDNALAYIAYISLDLCLLFFLLMTKKERSLNDRFFPKLCFELIMLM